MSIQPLSMHIYSVQGNKGLDPTKLIHLTCMSSGRWGQIGALLKEIHSMQILTLSNIPF